LTAYDGQERRASTLTYALRCMVSTLRFLTILPLPGSPEEDDRYFKDALFCFTPVGVIIGIAGAVFCWGLSFFIPGTVLALLFTLYLSGISGFFHLDGLADTADGFLSARPTDQCLEIMRDSRIGVMGAATICAVFMVKAAAFAAMDNQALLVAALLTPVAGRTAIVICMALLPYARTEGGLGGLFYTPKARKAAVLSTLLFIMIGCIVYPERVLLLALALFCVVSLFTLLCKKRIGGATGDTLGAVCELAEAAAALAFTVTF